MHFGQILFRLSQQGSLTWLDELILDSLEWKVKFESDSHRAETMLSSGNTRFG